MHRVSSERWRRRTSVDEHEYAEDEGGRKAAAAVGGETVGIRPFVVLLSRCVYRARRFAPDIAHISRQRVLSAMIPSEETATGSAGRGW